MPASPPLIMPSPALIERFAAIVGREHALIEPDAQSPYLREWRDLYTGRTPAVLKPKSTAEVAAILALANSERVGVVTQGGNTGLVGGQIPRAEGTDLLLSLSRLKAVRSIDAAGAAMTLEAGVTLAAAQALARDHGLLYPLSLASEGSATIGGTIATNAGGVAVLAYGTARNLVLGLEVVLADGTVWDGLGALKKNNTGYDLRDLFVGSEGTLGVITAATLKLVPEPRERATALAAVPDLGRLLPLFSLAAAQAGSRLTAFEFMCAEILGFVTAHVPGTRLPIAGAHPWYVLIELSGGTATGETRALLETLLESAMTAGHISDAAVAESGAQARDLWRLRDACSEAQKGEGGSIKHDISVPISQIPEFLVRAGEAVQRICPGARPVPFGHFGDGNVHYNVSQPAGMEKARFLALWSAMSDAVHDVAVALGGSISAEHGIGQMKRAELARRKSAVEMNLMRRIKTALDPNGILNPGKLI